MSNILKSYHDILKLTVPSVYRYIVDRVNAGDSEYQIQFGIAVINPTLQSIGKQVARYLIEQKQDSIKRKNVK